VRIAANYISIASPEGIQQIYGYKTGFLKGSFYEDMSLSPPTISYG